MEIPEFEDYVKDDNYEYPEKIAYLLFDCLGSFVSELMLKNASSEITNRCFNYINKIEDENDNDINNLLGVTFLESLASIKPLRTVTKLKLRGKAALIFQDILEGPMFAKD